MNLKCVLLKLIKLLIILIFSIHSRFYAVVHPFSSIKLHSKPRTLKIIAGTWVVALVLASPYIFCKRYAFNITSHLGSVSRQICTDRFDVIDIALQGSNPELGRFRQGFFLFLFLVIYLVPLVTIVTTSVRIAMCLLKPIAEHPIVTRYTHMAKRKEENKRKVRRC